ncbi:DinB family protein [Fontibacillus phaseoli]|uniref:DinB family protein n=1 Tax=Fontibacillus phaseoli TaxID=1416533 RepID=A0A369BIP9_9BACL|nr:DinB family protein [Fontibacillus phaseoli]RCX21470.1 DinB family protein [Fontibacillus phaseoli]
MMDELMNQFEEWPNYLIKIKDLNWETPLGEGKWRIHDVVSHIMYWDKYFFEAAIECILHGQELTIENFDFDQFNQGNIELGKNLNKDDLTQLTLKYRNGILESIKSMNNDQILQVYTDAEGNPFNIENYLRDFIWHDRHHMSQLEEALNRGDVVNTETL